MARLDGSERVLVVPAAVLETPGPSSGFRGFPRPDAGPGVVAGLLARASFVPRTEALEHGPEGLAWLQLVPYSLLTRRGEVFAFRRPARGGDSRLRGRASVGVGGHVNPVDGERVVDPGILGRALVRELAEEVGLTVYPRFRPAGLLFDPADDVGRRHVGVVYRVEVGDGEVEPDGAEVEPLGWYAPERLREIPSGEWEGWSRICVAHLGEILGPAPARR